MDHEEAEFKALVRLHRGLAIEYRIDFEDAIARILDVMAAPTLPVSHLRIVYPYWWQRLIPGWKKRWQARILAAALTPGDTK